MKGECGKNMTFVYLKLYTYFKVHKIYNIFITANNIFTNSLSMNGKLYNLYTYIH